MSVELWLAFVGASVLMLVIPGPTVVLVVGHALAHGRRTAIVTAAGVALGDFTAMTLSLLGLGAVLAASAAAFGAVKIAGALYLAWLGLKLWRAPVAVPLAAPSRDRRPAGRLFGHAFAVTALNPKSIVFFVAFVPQFIDRSAAFAPQVSVLVATFVVLAFANALAYALVATRLRRRLVRPRVLQFVNRLSGGVLIGAGAATLVSRSS